MMMQIIEEVSIPKAKSHFTHKHALKVCSTVGQIKNAKLFFLFFAKLAKGHTALFTHVT